MTDYGKWAFNNRKLVYFLIAVLCLGGLYSAWSMSKLEDPEVKVKVAMVITSYPGASAHQVELEVTDRLEKEIRRMADVYTIESYSYNDLSLIQVELLSTVTNNEVEQCWDLLRRRVSDAAVSLPQGAGTPMVMDDFSNVYGMFYALTGDGLNESRLADYADLVKRELLEIEGVEHINLFGLRQECIDISLKQSVMSNLGVKPAEVLATLNNQNKTTYSGYYNNGDNRIRISVTDRFTSAEDIGEMILQGHENDKLRLKDIALVTEGYEEPVRSEMFRDGERAIGLLVAGDTDSDIVKVGNAVEKKLDELAQTRFPAGIEYHKVFYQPDRVTNALSTFFINLIESVVIVVVVLMIAMGFRSGWMIAISLVVIVLGSFLFLYALGGMMQRVSLAAFILAMGMLVDNAIVITDGILVDLKAGKPRMEAMTAIGRQTAMPLLGATLIAIIAFLPIFMSPDTAGIYVRDLFIVLAVSLLLSWILALVHVPLMANRMLKEKQEDLTSDGRRQYKGQIYSILRKCLEFGLDHRWSCVALMLVLLILSLVGFKYMRQGFFPDMTYDQLYMEYKLPEGTNSERVRKDLAEIESHLKSREEITHITTSIGGSPGRYNLVRSLANPSLSYGELIIDFSDPESLNNNVEEIQQWLTQNYPDAYVKMKKYNLMFKKYPIEAQFLGPDPEVLSTLADSTRRIMEASDKVHLITQDLEPKTPYLAVAYNQPAARAAGLSRDDLSLSLLPAGGGIPIGSFYEGSHRNNIYLKCTDNDGRPIEDLSSMQITSTLPTINGLLDKHTILKLRTGQFDKNELITSLMTTTPIRQVIDSISVEWDRPVIPRFNGSRSVRVQCSPVNGVETEAARASIAEKIEQIKLPAGYSLRWQGEKAASTQSMKYLFKNFPLAIILMIAILIMLFKDYRKPTIIFCCIPFIMVGVVATMLLTGQTFNFVAIVGTLGLIGMVIKNGIVLMDEINLQIESGIDPRTALIESAQSRLRPVSMAALTTILGMIPLIWDAMFGSMAAAIMGGLLFGTIITLVFIPVLYALFFKIKKTAK